MLSGFSGDEDVKRAVSRLSRLIAEGDGAALSEELADKDERGQMLAIVTHVLSPLTGMKASVSKREYAAGTVDEEVIPREHLGIGTTDTWHGSPDCRCDIDIINVVTVEEVVDSSGAKMLIEMKRSPLNSAHLNQVIGNSVTYSFVHKNRHPTQNTLVPVVGHGEALDGCV